MTKEFKEKRTQIREMANKAGFENIYQMCAAIGLNEANLYTNLNGRYKISAKRMFDLANVLQCPIMQMIELFYPDEILQNRKVVMQKAVDSLGE